MRKRSVCVGPWAAVALTSVAQLFSSTAQAQVKLQYKFPEGQKLTYNTTEEMSQVLKLAGQAFATERKQTVLTSWTFGKKREDSTQPIAQKIEALAVEMFLPGGINSGGP
jgi:thermostable 8-oxoguanine DNA glycosylase